MKSCELCVEKKLLIFNAPLSVSEMKFFGFMAVFIFFLGLSLLFISNGHFGAIGSGVLVISLTMLILLGSIIGKTFYLFLDKHGKFHVHENNPAVAPVWAVELPENHPVGKMFQVRLGGWFRKNRVLGTRLGGSVDPFWEIVHCWDDIRKIRLRDTVTGAEIGALDLYGLNDFPAQRALEVVNRYKAVREIFDHIDEFEGTVAEVGRELIRIIRDIEQSKETMGRSKHAQALREGLNKLMNSFPPNLVNQWRKEAEDKKALAIVAQ